MHHQHVHDRFRLRAAWLSLIWAGSGLVLLLTSPLTCWTPGLGWSPLFWLVLAPLSVLVTLWMGGPRRARSATTIQSRYSGIRPRLIKGG